MNKLYFLLATLFLLALPTVAQETDVSEEEFRQKVDSVFEHVDLEQVETGILIEHGFNLLDPNAFNGQKSDSVYSNKEILKALYAGLYDSRVNKYCTLESTENTFPKIDNAENISILYLAYNQLRESDIKSGRIYLENEQLYTTDSYWSNVFDYDFCFAIALGKDEFVGKDVTIPIKIDNLINNLMAKVLQIEVKVDDGSYEKVKIDTDWKHSFAQLGEHWLTFRILFDDGFIFECRTPITLTEPRSQQLAPFDKPVETFMTIAADSEQSGGELQVIYLNKEKTSGKFIRPLVIAGDINLSGLLTGGASTPIDLKTIGASGSIGTKIAELSQIYDIIYLKYNDDTDDLLRNGKLLRRALQAVNDNRFTVSDDTYVVGLGVGGVIARIGINMMESEGENHRVCKFIAVNSPFRGVNIPASIQFMIRHMKQTIGGFEGYGINFYGLDNIDNFLNTKIAKQLICNYVDSDLNFSILQRGLLLTNAVVQQNPKKCLSVAITNAGATIAKQNETLINYSLHKIRLFGSKRVGVNLNAYIKADMVHASDFGYIYQGDFNVYFKFLFVKKNIVNKHLSLSKSNGMLPVDNEGGIYIPKINYYLTKLLPPFEILSNFCLIPGFSSLDIDYVTYKDLDYQGKIAKSPFDRVYIKDNATYQDAYSSFINELAYELVPHIEGQTSDVLGTTELTVANVPTISLIKYEWTLKQGNFKVVSSSKNKAILTPTKYSTSDSKITDEITVTPKVQLVSIPGIENLKVSTTASSAYLYVKGNDYISPELGVYSLSQVPDDVTTIDWTASKGVELTPYEDMTVGATVQKATTDRWIQASFTSYGVTHDIRKSLKVATLDSVSMKMVKHWRNKQEELDKYYFHIDIYPSSSIDEMTFCWYNTVSISQKSRSLIGGIDKNPGITMDGLATIKTEGNVGICRFIKDNPIIDPITSIRPLAINDLPDIPVEPVLMGKNEAIVSMPKIGTDEVAEGDVYCDVKDKFGTKYTVHYPVESHYAVIYSVAPNPADAVITIVKVVDGEDNGVSTYSLGSAVARLYSEQTLVREQAMGEGNCRMNVADLPDGTYYLVVSEDGETIMRQTVIIKH